MTTPALGPWQPLDLDGTVDVFLGARFRWWIAGGRAFELHLDRSWREHDDTDVGVLRRDLAHVRSLLSGWDIHVAAAGRLSPWTGEELDAGRHENNLWCRRRRGGAWELDLTVGDGDDRAWAYRRDPGVRVPWEEAVLRTVTGVPYLAPELQLLCKSRDRRPKDDLDADEVIPELDGDRRARLARLLPQGHAWQGLTGSSLGTCE